MRALQAAWAKAKHAGAVAATAVAAAAAAAPAMSMDDVAVGLAFNAKDLGVGGGDAPRVAIRVYCYACLGLSVHDTSSSSSCRSNQGIIPHHAKAFSRRPYVQYVFFKRGFSRLAFVMQTITPTAAHRRYSLYHNPKRSNLHWRSLTYLQDSAAASSHAKPVENHTWAWCLKCVLC